MPGFGSPADSAAPRDFDYDMWLGPAPARPYNPQRGIYHFRWFWDYSGGQMTNLGAHEIDIMQWVMGVAGPTAVSSTGGRFAVQDIGETPDTQDALFEYPGFTTAYSFREASAGRRAGAGLEFFGTKGSMTVSRAGFEVFPDMKSNPANAIPVFQGQPAGGPERATVKPEPWVEAIKESGSSAAAVRPARAQFSGLREEPPAPHRRCRRRPSNHHRLPSGQPLAAPGPQAQVGSGERGNPGRPRGLRHAGTPVSQALGRRAARSALVKRRSFLAAPLAAAYPLAAAEPEARVYAFGDGIPHTPAEYTQLLATLANTAGRLTTTRAAALWSSWRRAWPRCSARKRRSGCPPARWPTISPCACWPATGAACWCRPRATSSTIAAIARRP